MNRDELIAAIALQSGITLYRRYGEAEAAKFLDMSEITLKRRRYTGDISFLKLGERKIAFFGFQLVEYLLDSVQKNQAEGEEWQSTDKKPNDSKSAITGSASSPAARRGAGHGSTSRLSRQDALASARRILQKPPKN